MSNLTVRRIAGKIYNLEHYYHPQAPASQVSNTPLVAQDFQASQPRPPALYPGVILFRPSPSGQETITRFGQDGLGTIFRSQFDRTGWNCSYMPYGILPPPGSEIVELFDPVEFAGGFKGDWLNDPTELMSAKDVIDASLEHAGTVEDSLEDIDALLAFTSER